MEQALFVSAGMLEDTMSKWQGEVPCHDEGAH